MAAEARHRPILDIGFGGGRTTAFLRSVSADYVGVDHEASLVQAARTRYPDGRFEHMDARDLCAFEDQRFALVVFSSNGIDCVPHGDRQTVLDEIHRVLVPGGLFAYSTRNLAYRLAGHRPAYSDWRRALTHPVRALRYALRLPKLTRQRRRLDALTAHGHGWATVSTLAYGCPVVWHQVTLAEAWRELRGAGFTGEVEVYGPSGVNIKLFGGSIEHGGAVAELNTSGWPSFHLVARRP